MVRILTDPSVPGWAQILATGGTFTWETWTPSDLIGDSMSHGWGSSALVAMQETLLGLSLMEPNPDGTVRVAVAPPSAGLARATGSVPTIAGSVTVSWQRRGAGVALDLIVPANASALVHLPASDPLERPRRWCRRGEGARSGRVLGRRREGRAVGGKRELPFHQRCEQLSTPRPR